MPPTSASTSARGPVQLELDWDALEVSVERNASDTESFLDLATGKVVTIVAGDVEAPLRRQQVTENLRAFLRIEPASSREQYRWMERFVGSVADESLRDRLIMSIDGKGAFRRFKDVLLSYPVERDRWFSYRANLLHIYIDGWLASQDVSLGAYPPWGKPEEPTEPNVPLEKPLGERGVNVSETLRRTARELIDRLPALELPAAIAYMQYLQERMPSVIEPTP